MPLPNNYFTTRSKPYAVLESDLDSINNYLNSIADEVRPPARGGTGLSAFTIGDLIYASGTTTLAKIALATDGHYLTSNGSIPQYREIVQAEVSGLKATETPTFDQVTTTTKVITDTIDERTGAAGVTIDSVHLKDGGATFISQVDLGSNKIIGVTNPTISSDVANKGYVDSLLQGLDWQESVIDRVDFVTAEPDSPSLGDRYINTVTGTSQDTSQSVTEDYIYEWNNSDWTEIIPNEGYATWVEDEDVLYVYTDIGGPSDWVKFGTTTTHQNLIGAGTNTHSQIDTIISNIGVAGSGNVVDTDSPQTLSNKALSTPSIADFQNSQHDHEDAAGGGGISLDGISDPDKEITTWLASFLSAASGAVLSDSTAGTISYWTLGQNEWAKFVTRVPKTGNVKLFCIASFQATTTFNMTGWYRAISDGDTASTVMTSNAFDLSTNGTDIFFFEIQNGASLAVTANDLLFMAIESEETFGLRVRYMFVQYV